MALRMHLVYTFLVLIRPGPDKQALRRGIGRYHWHALKGTVQHIERESVKNCEGLGNQVLYGATWEQTDRAQSLFSREVQEMSSWITPFDAARMDGKVEAGGDG
jgi:hypothetical protein